MFPLFFTSIAIKENSGKNYKVIRFIEMGGRVKPRKYWANFSAALELQLSAIERYCDIVSSQLIQLSFGYVKSSTPLQIYKTIQWGMELLSNLDPHHKMHFLFHVLLRKPIQTIFPHSSCDLHDWGLVLDRGIAHGDQLLIWYWSFCCCSIFGGKKISSETLKLNFQNYSTHAYLQNCSNSTKANDLKSEIF